MNNEYHALKYFANHSLLRERVAKYEIAKKVVSCRMIPDSTTRKVAKMDKCKQCNCGASSDALALVKELNDRKQKAREERERFLAERWPRMRWLQHAPYVVPVLYLLGFALRTWLFPVLTDERYFVFLFIFVVPIVLALGIGALFIRKRERLFREFEQRCDDAKLLRQ